VSHGKALRSPYAIAAVAIAIPALIAWALLVGSHSVSSPIDGLLALQKESTHDYTVWMAEHPALAREVRGLRSVSYSAMHQHVVPNCPRYIAQTTSVLPGTPGVAGSRDLFWLRARCESQLGRTKLSLRDYMSAAFSSAFPQQPADERARLASMFLVVYADRELGAGHISTARDLMRSARRTDPTMVSELLTRMKVLKDADPRYYGSMHPAELAALL